MSTQEVINVYTDWIEVGGYLFPRSYESFAEYCLGASHIDILATTIGRYKRVKADNVLHVAHSRCCGFCVLYLNQRNREDCEGCPIRRWTYQYCVDLPMSNHDTMLKAAERLLEHWLTGSELDLEDLGIEEVQDVL